MILAIVLESGNVSFNATSISLVSISLPSLYAINSASFTASSISAPLKPIDKLDSLSKSKFDISLSFFSMCISNISFRSEDDGKSTKNISSK